MTAPILAGAARVDESSTVVARPANIVDDGDLRLEMEWAQLSHAGWYTLDTTALVEVTLTPLDAADDVIDLADSGAEVDIEGDTSPVVEERHYRVDGTVVVDDLASRCNSIGPRWTCRVTAMTSATLSGSAVRRGDQLTVEFAWRTFGFGESSTPGQPSQTVSRWAASAGPGDEPFAVATDTVLAETLERSGFIGAPLVFDLISVRPLRLAASAGNGSGSGTIGLVTSG